VAKRKFPAGGKTLANEGGDYSLCGFSNAVELAADNGWTLIPYGEWPHAEGIQVFGQKQAEQIVQNFKSGWARFKRAVVGLPVFKGHPDLADTFKAEIAREKDPLRRQQLTQKMQSFANAYPDKTEYGQVADMEVRDNGLAIRQVLSEAGAALVNAGLKFISPHWGAMPIGERDGKTLWAPRDIRSVGLTSFPNIPNKSLVNTAHAETSKPMNREKLIKLLGLANEATDEQIEAAVAAALARPTAADLANEKTAAIAATNRAQTAEDELKRVKAERDTAAQALANAQEKAITDLLDSAVKGGKIAEAEKVLWKKRLERDFSGESVALANSQTLKTKPTAEQLRLAEMDRKIKQGLGNDNGEGGDRPNILALVNAEMSAPCCNNIKNPTERYNKAFANVKARFPKLFAPVTPYNAS
jgi:hypothetical protein